MPLSDHPAGLTLATLLVQVPQGQRVVIETLRDLIRAVAPEAAETVLWRSLSYHRPSLGGRIKGAVCLITPKADCVHLGFVHGAALADPDHVLRGAGIAKRFVPIQRVQDVHWKAVAALIEAAAKYDPRSAA